MAQKIFSTADLDTLARTIFGEARGEPLAGQVAVAWTVVNRVRTDLGNDGKPDWLGETVFLVCRAHAQYSCWNPTDANLDQILSAGPGTPGFLDCLGVAAFVLTVASGHHAPDIFTDPTAGATHYVSLRLPLAKWPSWAKPRHGSGVVIGNHEFFAGVER